MKAIRGLFLRKLQKLLNNSTLFVTEKKNHLLAFSIIVIGMEIFLLTLPDSLEFRRNLFALSTISLFFGFSVLEAIFRHYINKWIAPIFSIIPGLILLGLLWNKSGSLIVVAAIAAASILKIIFSYMPCKNIILTYGCVPLDIISVFLWLQYSIFKGQYLTDKLLFVCLVIMTLAAFQELFCEKRKASFPFHYFLLLGILMLFLPVKETPIDWTPAIKAYGKLSDATQDATYYISNIFGSGSYTTGYSDLNVSGGKLTTSEKPQLKITTKEKPYFVYTNDSSVAMRTRRHIYLAGDKGVDKQQLVTYLNFLHANNVYEATANLFSEISKMSIEYVYLNTKDTIAPNGSISLSDANGSITSGNVEDNHKKGYSLDSIYLDIDYGSPYFIELIKNDKTLTNTSSLSYNEAVAYMKELYALDLATILTKDEYDSLSKASVENYGKYLELGNARNDFPRMDDLAKELTSNADNDYDKCKIVEAYLRQYTYNTDAVGGHNTDSTMATPDGMADIADRFLFETKEGYCVHFTSSMVTLLRMSGIPARAVNGYRYVFPFTQEEEYLVTASCAHVWPEAYIKGVGWIPFEPTSSYLSSDDFTWHRKAKEESEDLQNVNTNSETVPAVPTIDGNNDSSSESDSNISVLKLVALVVLSILLLLGMLIIGAFIYKRLRYQYASPAQRLKMDVESIKSVILKKSSVDFNDRGLLSDYIYIAPHGYQAVIKKVFDLYYRSIYSENTENIITEADSNFAKDLREELKHCK